MELAYNSSVQSSTGFSPFFLAHGREPRLPAVIFLNCSPAVTSCTPGTPADYARDLTPRLSCAFKDAAVQSAAAKLNQKRQYDKTKFFHPHKPGDFVFLDDLAQKQNKLAPKCKGPYKIMRRMDKDDSMGVTYKITDPRNPQSRRWVVHYNCPKPYKGPQKDLPATSPLGMELPVISNAEAPSIVPLTALSGALPFRPSTPPFVLNQTVKQTTTNARTECSNPIAEPDIVPSLCVSPAASMVPDRHVLPLADVPQLTHSGRMVKKPEKFKDFVFLMSSVRIGCLYMVICFLLYLCFLGNSEQNMCTSALYYI